MSRSKKFIRETAWYSLFSNSKMLLQFFSSLILARLLTPADFGLVAMVSVVIGFSSLFIDLGLAAAYIQKHEVKKAHANALFFQSALFGTLIALLLFACRGLIADFYHNPKLIPIIVGMAIDLMITALSVTPSTILRRDSRFKELGLLGLVGLVISMTATITFALMQFNVMSIVYGVIIKDIFMLIASGTLARWKPSIAFDRITFNDMLKLGGWLSLTRILGFFSRQMDTLLVGKYFGAESLGIYNRAYALMLIPLQKVGNVVADTALPTLKDFQFDDNRLFKAIEKIIITELIFLIPIVLFVWSQRFIIIDILYGPQWREVSHYLTYLLPIVIFDLGRSNFLQAFVIKNQTRAQFLLSIISTGVVIAAIIIGVLSKDIMNLVMLYSLSKIIIWLPSCKAVAYLLNARLRDVLKYHVQCIMQYWPLFMFVAIQIIITRAFGISPYNIWFFVICSAIYLILTLMCINSFSKNKNFEFLFESFAFLKWPQKHLRMLHF